jgi:hypothetical protein
VCVKLSQTESDKECEVVCETASQTESDRVAVCVKQVSQTESDKGVKLCCVKLRPKLSLTRSVKCV